jgi:uncharacterized membrane protein
MKHRRNLDREGLEVYLVNLLLAYRPLFQLSGFIIFVYALVVMAFSITISIIAFVVAIFLGLVSYSYQLTLSLAKIGAWLGTIGKNR